MPSSATNLTNGTGMVSTDSTDFAGDVNDVNHFRIVATTETTLNLELGEMAEIVGPVYVPDDRLEVHGDFKPIFDGRNEKAAWVFTDDIPTDTQAFREHLQACLSLAASRDKLNHGYLFYDSMDISSATNFYSELSSNILSQLFGRVAAVFIQDKVEAHLLTKLYDTAQDKPLIFTNDQCDEIYEILRESDSLGLKRRSKNTTDAWEDIVLDEGDIVFDGTIYEYIQYIKGWSNKDFMGIKVVFKQAGINTNQQTATLCLFQDDDFNTSPQVRFVKVIDNVSPNTDSGYDSSQDQDVDPSLL